MEERKVTIYDLARMCKTLSSSCVDCPLDKICDSDFSLITDNVDKYNEAILKWCDEHPIKTRQSEFLKIFPKTPLIDGIINICPIKFDGSFQCRKGTCANCEKKFWMEEI